MPLTATGWTASGRRLVMPGTAPLPARRFFSYDVYLVIDYSRCGECVRVPCELTCCKPGLRPFPVFVLFSPVMGRNPGAIETVPVARVSCCRRVTYGKDHRRQVVLRVLFFSCYLQANRLGSARSSACACSRALPNRTSRRRINAPGSRSPRSAERHWFAVPSDSGQIARGYRKWVAARFRLSAFDGTPAHCRCE